MMDTVPWHSIKTLSPDNPMERKGRVDSEHSTMLARNVQGRDATDHQFSIVDAVHLRSSPNLWSKIRVN
jgi:hypothetical protein